MAIHTPWSVRQDHQVTSDLGSDGLIRDDAAQQWIALALAAYLEQCAVLERTRAQSGLELTHRTESRPGAVRLPPAPAVMVTATATEVLPASFVVAVRVRPVGGDDEHPLDVTCAVRLEDPATGEPQPLSDEIRDELIALAHAARHYN